MKRSLNRKSLILIVVCGAALAAGLGASTALGSLSNPKGGADPNNGLTDAQRQAIVDHAHVRNNQFLQNFHGDPHKLPVVEVSTYAAPPVTLSQAEAASALILIGHVQGVAFSSNPGGGMPLSTSTIVVERVLKGTTSSMFITVHQRGGPVAQAQGGALAELDTDKLLLTGDHVLLMLSVTAGGAYSPLPGAGVNEIDANGRIAPEDSNPFGDQIAGKSVDAFATLIAA